MLKSRDEDDKFALLLLEVHNVTCRRGRNVVVAVAIAVAFMLTCKPCDDDSDCSADVACRTVEEVEESRKGALGEDRVAEVCICENECDVLCRFAPSRLE